MPTSFTIVIRKLTPESAALLALLQAWDIYMASKSTMFEGLREVVTVDLVAVH